MRDDLQSDDLENQDHETQSERQTYTTALHKYSFLLCDEVDPVSGLHVRHRRAMALFTEFASY